MPTENYNYEENYNQFKNDQDSSAIATVKILFEFIKRENYKTVSELSKLVKEFIAKLKEWDSRIEVESVAEIYLRFITLVSAKFTDFEALKAELFHRSQLFINKLNNTRSQLAMVAQRFITDDSVILVHSYSRAVLETLREARNKNKHFQVYVTESAPDYSGRKLVQLLKNDGFDSVTLILEAAIGYIMSRIDLVLVGAEGVTQSGGIINKIGTYQLAICAKAHNKAFYVLAETYKFIRDYPLTQSDVQRYVIDRRRIKEFSNSGDNNQQNQIKINEQDEHPLVDYTPPNYITLLMTDLGPLTTAAVCDMLVRLYT